MRGGRQDRLLAVDLVVEPGSGRVPIDSFCVEAGRWQQRGSDSAILFDKSPQAAPSATKVAALGGRGQGEVWANVATVQGALASNLDVSVTASESPTSLQLTLENEKVRESAAAYSKALSGAVDGRADVIGVVFAINGRLQSADCYATRELFRKLWPKLLDAAAVEAIAWADKPREDEPTVAQARAFMTGARDKTAEVRKVSERVQMLMRDGDEQLLFDTWDAKGGGANLHMNCLRKPAPGEAGEAAGQEAQQVLQQALC